jgi:Flp pilus assembly protein CpaB
MTFRLPGLALRQWPRRLLALGCLALALLSFLSSRSAKPAAVSTPIAVAARPLGAGHLLVAADIRVTPWPSGLSPPGSFVNAAAVLGRRVAGPVGAGEAITSYRLVGAGLAAGLPAGTVAATVTLADSGALALVHLGDYVDLLLPPVEDDLAPATGSPGAAATLAHGVLVLAVIPPVDQATSSTWLVVAVDEQTALRLAAAAARPVFAIVRSPP